MMWSQYFAVLPIAVQQLAFAGSWWLRRRQRGVRWRMLAGWASAVALGAVLLLPLLPILRDQLAAYGNRGAGLVPGQAGAGAFVLGEAGTAPLRRRYLRRNSADHGRAAEGGGVPGDQRRGRLVHVDHVVVPALQLRAHAHDVLGEHAEVRDGAVRADADRASQRDQVVRRLPELGLGAMQATADSVRRVPRREHANVFSSRDELLRQRLNVPVDAPSIGPGIGGDKGNAHRVGA